MKEDKNTPTPQAQDQKGTARRAQAAEIGRDTQTKIGQHLRMMFDGVVKEGVPAQFTDLLGQLEKAGGKEP